MVLEMHGYTFKLIRTGRERGAGETGQSFQLDSSRIPFLGELRDTLLGLVW